MAASEIHVIGCAEGMELVLGRHSDFCFARYAHPYYTIGLNVEGEHRFICRGSESIVHTGQVILINPDEAHSNEATHSQWMCLSLCVTPHMLTSLGPLGRQSAALQTGISCDTILRQRIGKLAACFSGTYELLELQTACVAILAYVFRRFQTQAGPRRDPPIECIRQMLAESPETDTSLPQLAAHAGTSVLSLLRSFTKTVGCTPHVYQTAMRIDRSKQHLKNGLTVVDTALRCGFVDQSHFTRIFKKWTGTTPARYQAEVALGEQWQPLRQLANGSQLFSV